MSKCALEFADDAVEGQPCPLAFGLVSRRVVMNRWAAVTRVAWWCQPVQERPSKWSRPRPVFSSRKSCSMRQRILARRTSSFSGVSGSRVAIQ